MTTSRVVAAATLHSSGLATIRSVWNPGEGSDVVEGQAGFDTLVFNGANINENFNISANHGRVKLTRDVGNVTMDLNGVERIELDALGGTDNITVGDLTGTGMTQVAIDLASPAGSGTGDGAADSVTVTGTAGSDHVVVTGAGTSIDITGLPAEVTINGAEGANDKVTITTGAGNDSIDASTVPAGVIGFTIDAGAGNDRIIGSHGADMLIGGDGNDFVDGGQGNDVAFLGAGNDVFQWDPGDGSDIVEGQDGTDTLLFNGSNANENIDISANGSRVRLFRDVGNVTMDLNGIEHVQVAAAGGTDTITVDDLTGTDTKQVAIDLSSPLGSGHGDGQPDTVIVNGTAGDDRINVVSSGGSVLVNGLAAQVSISGAEAGKDNLVVNGLAGNDTIDASKPMVSSTSTSRL